MKKQWTFRVINLAPIHSVNSCSKAAVLLISHIIFGNCSKNPYLYIYYMMTVADLKKLLSGVDDDTMVLISKTGEFDGFFVSPCVAESGLSEITAGDDNASIEEQIEEQQDMTELDFELSPKQKVFMILPHGFTEHPDEDEPDPQNN